jgi:hypothetical protein
MMNRSLILNFVLSASSLFAETEKQTIPIFHDQDKVCWVGDSITASGLYHSYIYLYYSTRFPSLHLSFVN